MKKKKIRKTSSIGVIGLYSSDSLIDELYGVEELLPEGNIICIKLPLWEKFGSGTPDINKLLSKSSKLEVNNKTK